MRVLLARAVQFILDTRKRVWSAVISAVVLFGLFEFLVARWFIGVNLPPDFHAALQACIVGVGAGTALWFVLVGMVERRSIVADELRRVAELNHAIRNALELIVLANYSDADRERSAIVLECTGRIDQTLKELFPALGRRNVPDGDQYQGDGKSSYESPGSPRAPKG